MSKFHTTLCSRLKLQTYPPFTIILVSFPPGKETFYLKIVNRKGHHEAGSFVYVALGVAESHENAENRFWFGQAVFQGLWYESRLQAGS